MAYFLLKTEPSDYSFVDLQRDKKTTWTGVKNAAALIHLRSMHKGDQVFIYYTGNEKSVIGIAEVVSESYVDPKGETAKDAVIDLKPIRALARPLTLAEIKADKEFAGWDLIRIGRLSVVPTTAAQWNAVMKLTAKL